MAVAQPFRIALAQINAVVGDIEGNVAKIREGIGRARDERAQLVIFPELAISGYPPEDLLLKTHFLDAADTALDEIAAAAKDVIVLVGYPERADDVYNSLAVLAEGELKARYRKTYLPNYGVFDEHRYFQIGEGPALIDVDGLLIGLTICEDIWEPGPPATTEALAGATLIVNASASPYHHGKGGERERMITQRARDTLAVYAYCNLVGGQDELVFDGHSVVIDEHGEIVGRAAQFAEELMLCDIDPSAAFAARLRDGRHRSAVQAARPHVPVIARLSAPARHKATHVGGPRSKPLGDDEEIYAALLTGVRDYVEKNGFHHVVLGLSGGIDSALVAILAVDALGPDRVSCVVMPSPYSSNETQEDARQIARNLGVELIELPIADAMNSYEGIVEEKFAGTESGLAEENLQARIRGNLVMALSNKFGWLVLTTGNKSELSVGYATLYGDMAGGFAVLKDVFKTRVYSLIRWRLERSSRELIPQSVVDRAPSAELRPDQRDEDSLPPYDVLDEILEAYIEEDQGREQLVRRGLPEDVVDEVIRKVDLAEYKRRQAPPGIKISPRAFGRDRRLPITNRFRG
jgi:NAD+ synthase (glutamine-hydrolysing)